MKILRKNNDFRKMPDSSISDAVEIKSMIDYGWKYCSKREYKDFFSKPTESQDSDDNDLNEKKHVKKSERKKERKKKD